MGRKNSSSIVCCWLVVLLCFVFCLFDCFSFLLRVYNESLLAIINTHPEFSVCILFRDQGRVGILFCSHQLLQIWNVRTQSLSRSIINSDFRKSEIYTLDFSNTNYMENTSRVIENLWYNSFHQQLSIKISHWNCMKSWCWQWHNFAAQLMKSSQSPCGSPPGVIVADTLRFNAKKGLVDFWV